MASEPVAGARRWVTRRRWCSVGGALLPLGVVVIALGWYGVAHSPFAFEQNSYLISGGLFGLGLVLVGGFLASAAGSPDCRRWRHFSISSCSQIAAREFHATGRPVRRTTSTVSSPLPDLASASSVFFFSGTNLPPRTPSSAVMMNLESASSMSRRGFPAKSRRTPPNEWRRCVRRRALRRPPRGSSAGRW